MHATNSLLTWGATLVRNHTAVGEWIADALSQDWKTWNCMYAHTRERNHMCATTTAVTNVSTTQVIERNTWKHTSRENHMHASFQAAAKVTQIQVRWGSMWSTHTNWEKSRCWKKKVPVSLASTGLPGSPARHQGPALRVHPSLHRG